MRYALLALLSLSAFGQNANFVASAATTAFTLQAGTATGSVNVMPSTVSIYCAAAQTATFSFNGTKATSTAGTAVPVPGTPVSATATVWTASNSSSGTTGSTYPIPTGSVPQVFDLSKMFLVAGSAAPPNITVSTTGTCTIAFYWSEK